MLSGVGPLTEVPVPERLTVWVLLKLLSSTDSVAVRVPVAVGSKTIVIVHDAPAATGKPMHWSSVRLKSSGSPPTMDTPLMNCAVVPVLVNVTVCATLVVPTACGPNVSGDGLSDTDGDGRRRDRAPAGRCRRHPHHRLPPPLPPPLSRLRRSPARPAPDHRRLRATASTSRAARRSGEARAPLKRGGGEGRAMSWTRVNSFWRVDASHL